MKEDTVKISSRQILMKSRKKMIVINKGLSHAENRSSLSIHFNGFVLWWSSAFDRCEKTIFNATFISTFILGVCMCFSSLLANDYFYLAKMSLRRIVSFLRLFRSSSSSFFLFFPLNDAHSVSCEKNNEEKSQSRTGVVDRVESDIYWTIFSWWVRQDTGVDKLRFFKARKKTHYQFENPYACFDQKLPSYFIRIRTRESCNCFCNAYLGDFLETFYLPFSNEQQLFGQ